jgi:glutathione S-transferase
VLARAQDVEIPSILDYLEAEVPGEAWLFGEISVADIAISVFFRNAAFAGFQVDAGRWPRTAAFVARTLNHPAFLALRPFEELLLRTPIPRQRDALREAGAPVSEHTLGGPEPRRGILAT